MLSAIKLNGQMWIACCSYQPMLMSGKLTLQLCTHRAIECRDLTAHHQRTRLEYILDQDDDTMIPVTVAHQHCAATHLVPVYTIYEFPRNFTAQSSTEWWGQNWWPPRHSEAVLHENSSIDFGKGKCPAVQNSLRPCPWSWKMMDG